MKTRWRRLCVVVLASLTVIMNCTVVVFAEGVVQDPLERPAVVSKLAAKSVLLSVTLAGKRIVAAGENGIIVFSDDYGASWRQANVPVSVTLTSVRFVTSLKGWALGHSGVVLHSKDGGETWVKQFDGNQAATLALKAAEDKADGMADPPSEDIKQQIANAQLLVDDGADKPFFDLYFENEQTGFIIGAFNLIFKTVNGGKNWQPWMDHVENPGGLHLYGIQELGNDLFVAGEQGILLRSDDRGEAFNAMSSPYDGSFFGLLPFDNRNLISYGLRGNAYISADKGGTWQKSETGVSTSITGAVRLSDGNCALVTQYGDILVSHDQGVTFKKIIIEEPFPFTAVTQVANGNLVVVGVRGIKVVPAPLRIAGAATE